MQTSNKPSLIPVPFADSGTKNTIPTAASPTPGLASLTTGFPPVTMTPIAAGGIPPAGADFNGILNLISAAARWAQAGGSYGYSSSFATSIGGYPAGAVLVNAFNDGFWLNLTDNNTSDPDAGGAGWVPAFNQGIASMTLTNANVTLTAAQYGKPIVILFGTLTANVQIIFPNTKQQWLVYNQTSGNFSVTCKTSSGSGVVVQTGGAANIFGDGSSLYLPSALQVGAGTQSAHALQLSQKGLSLLLSATSPATSTFTVPAGIFRLYFRVYGGGGGGGSAITGSAGNGGGAGGYTEGWLSVTPGQSIPYVVGAAGGAGSGSGIGGTAGGTSSLNGTITANGGGGGSGGGTGGGVGGSATGGDFNISGAGGTGPSISNGTLIYYGPPGGGSYGAGPSAGGYGTGIGTPGKFPGGGGSAGAGGSQGVYNGGAGATGAIFIWG